MVLVDINPASCSDGWARQGYLFHRVDTLQPVLLAPRQAIEHIVAERDQFVAEMDGAEGAVGEDGVDRR